MYEIPTIIVIDLTGEMTISSGCSNADEKESDTNMNCGQSGSSCQND